MPGILGLIANPLVRVGGVLSTFSEESLNMLLWNAIGGGVLIGWHVVMGIILFVALDRMGVLRVAADAEMQGLDVVKHKEKAYGFGSGTSPVNILPPMNTVMNVASLGNNKVDALNFPMNVNVH